MTVSHFRKEQWTCMPLFKRKDFTVPCVTQGRHPLEAGTGSNREGKTRRWDRMIQNSHSFIHSFILLILYALIAP